MSSESIENLRNSSSMIIAVPIAKSKIQPGKADYKVMVLQRGRVGTSASAHVFPDKADHDPRWAALVDFKPKNPNDPPLCNAICAIRETFEESGLLVTEPSIELSDNEMNVWREKVHNNAAEFYTFCTTHNVKPAVDRLCHFSTWITPPIEIKRFQTQFYLTVMPWSRETFSETRVFADGTETTRLDWFTPEEALEAYRKGEIQTFLPPQFVSLAQLLPVKQSNELIQHFQGREILTTMPEFVMESQDDKGLHLHGLLPGDEDHSKHVSKGHRHRILITRTKKGMVVRSYVQGDKEVKARL
ncbi:hypothetical protein BGW38_002679 [Lunasporangiospora selenospora]|uniref:Nudix hydrolase domain-containing protein n=1 Tax=Lunasporangiospora selenospora TaxID=979761 RepID=A0A9P6FS90_9FUNG|nr:hypothetical protein BGW38_002679 [Lunasporangiospora selenospora]